MPANRRLDYILVKLDYAGDNSDIFAFDAVVGKLLG